MNKSSLKVVLTITMFILVVFSSIGQEKRFTLLHTGDEHSNLLPLPFVDYHPERPDSSLGGFARLSTLVTQIREEKQDEPVLLFSSGDLVGGSPFAWLIPLGYSAELEIMKEIGYDAIAIGNHEFDYGPEVLADYFERAGYPDSQEHLPLLGTNLDIPSGIKLHEMLKPDNQLFTLNNGIVVGVFSLLGEDAYSVAPSAEPVGIHPPGEIARKQVDLLREKEADIIIALTHSGIEEDRSIASEIKGIDIILGSHDHYKTPEPEIINNTIILHSGYFLQYMGKLELAVDISTGSLKILNDEKNNPYFIKLDNKIEEDPGIAAIIYEYGMYLNAFVESFTGGLVSDYGETVVYSDFPLVKESLMEETTTGNFITDAMRLMGERYTGESVAIAFQANGNIRHDIIPGSTEWSKGEVSFLDLASISGIGMGEDMKPGYPLVSFYLTGEDVFTLLEIASLMPQVMGDAFFLQFSGLEYSYDPGKAFWLKIPILDIPVPAYRSVIDAGVYAGENIQSDDNFENIKDCNEKLYHLVSDYHLASFLPMIGEMTDRLNIVLRNMEGKPVEDIEQTIIKHDGREFKVWESIIRYAATFDKNEDGIPEMPHVYKDIQQRIVKEKGIPLCVWSYSIILLLFAGAFILARYLVVKIKKRTN